MRGFGVPIIEAQACGIPTMATDFTAMRDLIIDGVTGYKIKVASKYFLLLLSYTAIPSTESILDGMIKIYELGEDGRLKMVKCKGFCS